MGSLFRAKYQNVGVFKSKATAEKFGDGKKGLLICEICQAVYYKKHWHHSLEKLNLPESLNLAKVKKGGAPLKFVLCPACQMIKNHQFEGEIFIKNIPVKLLSELENLVINFCKRAYDRDPMDRLIAFKKARNNWVVTVTENELANKLGKKIQNLYNNVKAKTSFDRKPSNTARVVVEFLSKQNLSQ